VSAPMSGPRRSDAWSGLGTGWAVLSTLVAGMLLLGGLGYLIDRLVGVRAVFTAVGIVVGAALGIYIVYLRYGRGGE
jgi:ATP synthase protein I